MTNIGPAVEQIETVTDEEWTGWWAFQREEVARGLDAAKTRRVLCNTLVEAAADGGWCACAGHQQALNTLLAFQVWREPSA